MSEKPCTRCGTMKSNHGHWVATGTYVSKPVHVTWKIGQGGKTLTYTCPEYREPKK